MSEDVLLEIVSVRDFPDAMRRWADLLVRTGMAYRFGLYAERIPVSGIGIYIGRNDGRAVSDSARTTLERAAETSQDKQEQP